MEHQYYVILGERLIMARWPSEGISNETLVNAFVEQLNRESFDTDAAVVGDLILTDVPILGCSIENLDWAFKGTLEALPEFELWDLRDGKFTTVKRKPLKKNGWFVDRASISTTNT